MTASEASNKEMFNKLENSLLFLPNFKFPQIDINTEAFAKASPVSCLLGRIAFCSKVYSFKAVGRPGSSLQTISLRFEEPFIPSHPQVPL